MQTTARINWEEFFAKDHTSRHEHYRHINAQAMTKKQTPEAEHSTTAMQQEGEHKGDNAQKP